MRKHLGNLKILLLVLILTLLLVQGEVYAEEYFTFEMGTVTATSISDMHRAGFNPLEVSQIGYKRHKDNTYLHIFWGSLDGVHDHRTSYIFGELGYQDNFGDSPYFWALSIGIGAVSHTDDRYFTSHNMYTEAIRLGYENYYISLRHMSNGYEPMGNPGPNMGKNTITLGVEF
ncbi:hypothetical protein [Natroniella sp. ANB-PHB2]|uniref:hypothetical protein n=1 Tax=Natroniella sp. ANB-PHB2 TaxID=3384444 RepID=UPI0038D51160